MNYRTVVDPAVRRHIHSWNLSDYVLVEVEIRLNERLPASPTTFLKKDPFLFDSEGMVYGFDLIDPENRMLVHAFRFQVLYHSDEQTLVVCRGAHVTAAGL